mmetsp:Transcript_32760/g.79300  ORF Transcript_32760/g.79300 Transcript_32760/m.79300 type:complete len:165 (-) Transcript_32760:1300-1794(-)
MMNCSAIYNNKLATNSNNPMDLMVSVKRLSPSIPHKISLLPEVMSVKPTAEKIAIPPSHSTACESGSHLQKSAHTPAMRTPAVEGIAAPACSWHNPVQWHRKIPGTAKGYPAATGTSDIRALLQNEEMMSARSLRKIKRRLFLEAANLGVKPPCDSDRREVVSE